MKLLIEIEFWKRQIQDSLRGDTLNNNVIRDKIVLEFIKSIKNRSIVGHKATSVLLYHTMYNVYLPQNEYKGADLDAIAYASAKEMERILREKVRRNDYTNYDTPHSPYWQFCFQAYTEGTKIAALNRILDGKEMGIESETYPEGRDKTTPMPEDGQILSIKSAKPHVNKNLVINKDAFNEVKELGPGEYAVPFGIQESDSTVNINTQPVLYSLETSNSSFIVNKTKTKIIDISDSEIYIGGKNSHTSHNGKKMICVNDNGVTNPQVNITLNGNGFLVKSIGGGDVKYLSNRISNSGTIIPRGGSFVLNGTIQIIIR